MGERVAIVFSEDYKGYKFSEVHPLNPVRVELAVDLIESYGLLGGAGRSTESRSTEAGGLKSAAQDGTQDGKVAFRIEPRPATDEEIEMVHDARYVKAVKAAGDGLLPARAAFELGLAPGDNPIFPKMHEASAWIAGGSLVAAELVASGEFDHAFNPAGGLHHALRDRASGFCIYNDAAIACKYLAGRGLKVAYVDSDAHHGDGVQWIFYGSPQVLTISVHETGEYLFPGTGFTGEAGEGNGRGFSVNLPVPPACFDGAYLKAFREVVPPILRAFSPDVIISQNGCDGHFHDPLTHLSLTTNAYREVYRQIHGLAHEICGGRLVALGGGGYDLFDAVPRVWTLLFAELLGVDLPNEIPEVWLKKCRAKRGGLCPTELNDRPLPAPKESKEEVEAELNRAISEIKKALPLFFPT